MLAPLSLTRRPLAGGLHVPLCIKTRAQSFAKEKIIFHCPEKDQFHLYLALGGRLRSALSMSGLGLRII